MKGVVFVLLQGFVADRHGEDMWDSLLEASGADGAYTTVGTYPDDELAALVDAYARATETSDHEVIRAFGRDALPRLARRYPELFEQHDSLRSFLLALNEIIHPEVRRLYPGADVPHFEYNASSPEALRLTYRSHRGLCSFGEGLIAGAADFFGETVAVSQPRCSLRGDPVCELYVDAAVPSLS